jgi:hypothetical protein
MPHSDPTEGQDPSVESEFASAPLTLDIGEDGSLTPALGPWSRNRRESWRLAELAADDFRDQEARDPERVW